MTTSLSIDKVLKLFNTYTLVPIYSEMLADLETPISAFMKINKGKYCFLLDSVEGGERLARYSFMGINPYMIFQTKKNKCTLYKNGNIVQSTDLKKPINKLKSLLTQYTPYEPPDLPSFYGGAVGYFSYDSVRYMENISDTNKDDLDLPYLHFMFTDSIIVFDHVEHKIKIVYNLRIDENTNTSDIKKLYQKGIQSIESIYQLLIKPLKVTEPKNERRTIKVSSSITKNQFQATVERAKEYIIAGDIFQVQISRRLEVPVDDIDHFNIYRALRVVNPSPYMFYLKFDDIEVIGSSPELLVKKEGSEVIVRPLAGTRRRGKNPDDEIKMENELINDEKERAEHIMLVDLGRNDLGRVCEFGTVQISEDGGKKKLMHPEKYSHVMHLVSEVKGTLLKNKDAFDLFQSCFPAGTLTGTPKIRAMEIIEELEPTKRGLYGGGIAYFTFNGDMDSCIVIRTAVVKNNIAYIQTAGGIVYDSKPELEYLETQNKAKALLKALELSYKI